MASRRFFTYDPYDYYYTSPYHHYSYPYYQYQHHPTPSRGVGGFFPAAAEAAPEAVRVAPRPRVESSRPVSIPVRFVGSVDPEPEQERGAARMAVAPKKRAPSAEAAAVRVQAAARGLMARKSVRAVREVEREVEEAAGKIAREAEALRADARARVAVGEALMRLLLRLDAVRGAREYRRSVTKRVLALQDAVDALEPKTAAAAAVAEEEPEASAAVEMAEEMEVAPGQPCDGEDSGETEAKTAAAEMEVDGDQEYGEAEAVKETDEAQDGAELDDDKPEEKVSCDDAEGEWEMVTEESEPAAAAASDHTEARPQEPTTAQDQESGKAAEAGAVDGALDARKVMEMVAALCERSAQQCAVIGALAERVDALERAVRRVEDAERRRRRAKKLRKEGKGSNHNSRCYSD